MYYATAKEMERVDELAVQNGLAIEQMMELAGAHMLSLFEKLGVDKDQKTVIVCGKGNKGGDGLSAARHLINHGWDISVVLVSEDIKPDPMHHLELLRKMDADITFYSRDGEKAKEKIKASDVIIDALIGYHLDGPPRNDFKELIIYINELDKRVIAYDIPSGLDATTGECYDPCIKAESTLVLALLKKAFQTEKGKDVSGKIFLADIGIPSFVYKQINEEIENVFEKGELIQIY